MSMGKATYGGIFSYLPGRDINFLNQVREYALKESSLSDELLEEGPDWPIEQLNPKFTGDETQQPKYYYISYENLHPNELLEVIDWWIWLMIKHLGGESGISGGKLKYLKRYGQDQEHVQDHSRIRLITTKLKAIRTKLLKKLPEGQEFRGRNIEEVWNI